MKGIIFEIEKFAVHDGPGIRSVVFFKGCPLHCRWCHNPESWQQKPELLFMEEKCTGCRRCAAICPRQCHTMDSSGHRIDRTLCNCCGKCTGICPAGALEISGTVWVLEDVFDNLMQDKIFYDTSGGGVTLSGGEPLLQFEFISALLRKLKQHQIHTCMETSGFADWDRIEELLPSVDLWLWDVKALPGQYHELTGVDADLIFQNLLKLDKAGGQIILRCPLVPGVNDAVENLHFIADTANSLNHVMAIHVEPYHPLGENKRIRLGLGSGFTAEVPDEMKIQWYLDELKKKTDTPIFRG